MINNNLDYGMFPLRIFLFPGEQTTLHIFEPRYLQLITECLENNVCFGIPYQGKTTLSELGSLVKVNQILKKYESGELDVLIECQSNFKIHQFQNKNENKLYPLGSLSKIEKKTFEPSNELLKQATNYLKHLLDVSNDRKSEELISLNQLTNLVNLTDEEKIKFIGFKESKKNEFLVNKFKFMMILLTQEKMVDQNFYLN